MGKYFNHKGKEILNNINVAIGFHGAVEFDHPASVGGLIVNTAGEISKKGYSIKIFCDSSNDFRGKFDVRDRIQIFPFRSRVAMGIAKIYAWEKIIWISRKIAQSNVDIVHVHQRPELVIGYRYFKNNSAAVIFHVNSHPNSWIGKRFERAIKIPDLIISASKFIQKSLIDKFSFLAGKVEVLYNGVDSVMFKPSIKKLKRGKNDKRFVVFFAGNIWKEKGFDILVESAKELLSEEIYYVIAGDFDPTSNALHEEFRRKTPENVEYLGCVKHNVLPAYYSDADVTVVPSKWEDPCPLVVMESMACGTPVIGSKVGGIPELIDDKKNGLLVTPGSVNELREAILWCKNHPLRMLPMRIEARKKALKFDWKIISVQLGKMYEEILS